MNHIRIDVHTKESRICILAPDGELLGRRVRATAGGLYLAQPTHWLWVEPLPAYAPDLDRDEPL